MSLLRRKSRRQRAADKVRDAVPGGKSKPARVAGSVRDKVEGSGPGKTLQGAGMAGVAAGRHGKATAVYSGRKASGKRMPLLRTLPLFAAASFASFLAVRKMRQGVKQTAPP
jgi:hypothetical protein